MDAGHLSQSACIQRYMQTLSPRNQAINDVFTLCAHKVIVAVSNRIVPYASLHHGKARDHAPFLERSQRPIDRIERDCRHPCPNALVDLLGRRVIASLHHLPQNLEALMRRLQSRALADVLQSFDLAHQLLSPFPETHAGANRGSAPI